MNPFKLLVGNDHIDELRSKLHEHEQCLDTTQQSLVKLFNKADEVATLRAAVHALQFRCDKLQETVDRLDANNYELSVLIKSLKEKPKATPQRALNAAAVLADAIVKHEKHAATVKTKTGRRPNLLAKSPEQFYEQIGGYDMMRIVTRHNGFVKIQHCPAFSKPWDLMIAKGHTYAERLKRKTFNTRLEAEQFAYDVLKIHEAECIKRKSPTDWWNRVNIFEVTPNRRPA